MFICGLSDFGLEQLDTAILWNYQNFQYFDMLCLYYRLSDIGLEQFNTATLFVKLLTPTSFLILIILQVHYFHATFLRLSDIKHVK